MGDRVVILDQGRALQVDVPDVVYNKPSSAAVARFLNRYNIFQGAMGEDRRFVFAGGGLPLPEDVSVSAEPTSYCIRYDRIRVRPAGAEPAADDEVGMSARYITSEYSGSAIIYFFQLQDGKVVEVEYHLSHRKPEDFVEGDTYTLTWPREEALVYA